MSDLPLSATREKNSVLARVQDFSWNSAIIRKILVLALLALAWELSARYSAKPILFPSFIETMRALWEALTTENLLAASWASLSVLLKGYVIALFLAFVFVSLAVVSRFVRELLQTLITMFNPLPAIALLPVAMLWFGLGEKSLLVVLVHAVMWPFALATLTGFESVPETQRLVGRNYGLRGPSYVIRILIPAALPSILYGMKIAWAFAWRTLIAAELVFGVSSSSGGLGWFIFRNRNELFTDKVFAGLAMVIIIGLVVEGVIFRIVENVTVRRWGMQR
ncbi:ABC transporter permease [Neorhizobium galegae]|uniref:ABC transporter permease n=1 Tax=Neorhizobium galegae TaxID=399 RepID=UPI0006217DB9|nr:ABC transporter permease [Neorhizobium galegae]KAB1120453.1 ABC transporter permease [Neorhizobium galegae]MCQ1809049.1 ABC transporter permease [Neorhizobium galegae]CDZ63416.1 Nitrate/sulfonate/bicarbonate ABC transporter, permease protein [Neorhizobium galegae bv. orientalis]